MGKWNPTSLLVAIALVVQIFSFVHVLPSLDHCETARESASVRLPLAPIIAKSTSFPLPHRTQENIAILVLSRRGSSLLRDVIRESWGKHRSNVYFVVGRACEIPVDFRADDGSCSLQDQVLPESYFDAVPKHLTTEGKLNDALLEEQREHEDLLFMNDVPDVYRHLPQKIKLMYSFVDQYLPQVQWTLKVDDDFFVKVDAFSKYLQQFDTRQPVVVAGRVWTNHTAHVDGKWKEVSQFPEGGRYPAFPLGSFGHAVSRPIIEWVSRNQKSLWDSQGEDTSLGIWLNHTRAPKGVIYHQADTLMTGDGDCENPRALVIGHKIKRLHMLNCQRTVLKEMGENPASMKWPQEGKTRRGKPKQGDTAAKTRNRGRKTLAT